MAEQEKNQDIQQNSQSQQETKQKEEEKQSVKLSDKLKGILESIEKMTVLELSDLVKALEEKFGVSAQVQAMPVAAGVAASVAGAGQEQEEKSTFTVVLKEVGSNKIGVIKEIRAITTLGLKEAKDLVESAPKPIKEGASKEEAEKIKAQLEKIGAKVELQ